MFQDSENDNTEGGRRLYAENQARWSERWAMFRPPPGVHREARFHVDIPTMILSFMVGWPLGSVLAESLTGQQALGGIMGSIVMMLPFGFVRRQMQKRSQGNTETYARADTPARSPLRTIVRSTLGGAIIVGLLGLWFASSEGDIDYATAGTRFGAVGAIPGFLIGLVRAWRGRRRGGG